MRLKTYFGDRAFLKMALAVAVPIMLQNFITNLVSMLDNIMVGALGTEQMSGVSIVNQFVFIFNLAIFGGMSGVGIFTAQFFGKKDNEGIRYTFRFKLCLSVLVTAAAACIFVLFQDNLINLFLHDAEPGADLASTLLFAKKYLGVVLWGMLPFAIANVFAGTLRETGNTVTPMLASLAAVITNCVFNYLLIFGKFGFPELGVEGAAIATVLSRFVECFVIIIYTVAKRERFAYIKGALKSLYIPKPLFFAILKKGMPLLFNEILWSSGMSALSVAYSMHGLSVVAACSISSTVTNLFNISFLSMGVSIGIIAGKYLGAGDFDEAVISVRKLINFSLLLSVIIGIGLFFAGGEITRLYNTGEQSKELAKYFIRVCACCYPLVSYSNSSYFTLRSGGKTLITSLFDSGSLWLISVPAAFLLYNAAGLSIWYVFPIVQALEIIKVIIGFILVKKRVWVKTIV